MYPHKLGHYTSNINSDSVENCDALKIKPGMLPRGGIGDASFLLMSHFAVHTSYVTIYRKSNRPHLGDLKISVLWTTLFREQTLVVILTIFSK